MAQNLVTQVSQDQDQAKQAELARLQAAELKNKKESSTQPQPQAEKNIKKLREIRVAARVSSAAGENQRQQFLGHRLLLPTLLSKVKQFRLLLLILRLPMILINQ